MYDYNGMNETQNTQELHDTQNAQNVQSAQNTQPEMNFAEQQPPGSLDIRTACRYNI